MAGLPTPPVAPYQSCVSCFKGDVTTIFAVDGSAEWLIAALGRAAEIPQDQATQMVLDLAHDSYGSPEGSVPEARMQMFVTLCRDCARRTGTTVVDRLDLETGAVPGYSQPDDA
jgi:hypothetical protein